MRVIGLALCNPAPDAKTIWLYREQVVCVGTVERLFARFDALLRAKGWLAMDRQIIDATRAPAVPNRGRETQSKAAVRRPIGHPRSFYSC